MAACLSAGRPGACFLGDGVLLGHLWPGGHFPLSHRPYTSRPDVACRCFSSHFKNVFKRVTSIYIRYHMKMHIYRVFDNWKVQEPQFFSLTGKWTGAR